MQQGKMMVSKGELLGLILIFTFSFFYFFKDTHMLVDCLVAAAITTALISASYMVLRWFFRALN